MNESLGRITIDSDLIICSDGFGHWRLEGPICSFPLAGDLDFKRIISLLETPIDKVRSALGADFPYQRVIKIGLRHDSDYWIGLALSWIPAITNSEALSLVSDLKALSIDSSISQKNRQSARKHLKRIRA